MIFLIWLLNLFISFLNAAGCGFAWNYTKSQGGIAHFMNWMGAIMAACGFTWCILIPLAFISQTFGLLTPEYMVATLELGYVVLILPILGSGLAITLDSWVQLYKKPGLLNGGVAAWNTYATIRNTSQAVTIIPKALDHLGKVFGGKRRDSQQSDGKGMMALLVVFLVLAALAGGILTTRWIIMTVAAKTSLTDEDFKKLES